MPTQPNEIKGLRYLADYISEAEQRELLTQIDQSPWLDDLSRRVQHYGYKYDYKKRAIDASMKLGALPAWALALAQQLQEQGLFASQPDQLIINEYLPAQGISPHIDCEPCFDGTIASLSLGAACIMDFQHAEQKENKTKLLLEPRSLLVLSDEARYQWLHGIRANKTDTWQGQKIARSRRVSLTFRKVRLLD